MVRCLRQVSLVLAFESMLTSCRDQAADMEQGAGVHAGGDRQRGRTRQLVAVPVPVLRQWRR